MSRVFVRLFSQARGKDLQHLHSFSVLMRLSEFRLLSGGEWRSAAARNHTAARAGAVACVKKCSARRKRRSQLVTKRIVTGSRARPTALLALWVPFGREFAVTRRWVRDIPYRSAPRKKGDTRASSRDPQSILGLPSASFCFLTRHFMERKPLFAK